MATTSSGDLLPPCPAGQTCVSQAALLAYGYSAASIHAILCILDLYVLLGFTCIARRRRWRRSPEAAALEQPLLAGRVPSKGGGRDGSDARRARPSTIPALALCLLAFSSACRVAEYLYDPDELDTDSSNSTVTGPVGAAMAVLFNVPVVCWTATYMLILTQFVSLSRDLVNARRVRAAPIVSRLVMVAGMAGMAAVIVVSKLAVPDAWWASLVYNVFLSALFLGLMASLWYFGRKLQLQLQRVRAMPRGAILAPRLDATLRRIRHLLCRTTVFAGGTAATLVAFAVASEQGGGEAVAYRTQLWFGLNIALRAFETCLGATLLDAFVPRTATAPTARAAKQRAASPSSGERSAAAQPAPAAAPATPPEQEALGAEAIEHSIRGSGGSRAGSGSGSDT